MANAYGGMANTPCSIGRTGANGAPGDPPLALRVGIEGCPLPVGWPAGEAIPDNPIFFEKLKAATRTLTGAQNDNQLSGITLDSFLYQLQEPNPVGLAALRSVYPNGDFLKLPFFESISYILQASPPAPFVIMVVTFENTGGASPPRYADLVFTMDNAVNIATIRVIIKIFHSLTT